SAIWTIEPGNITDVHFRREHRFSALRAGNAFIRFQEVVSHKCAMRPGPASFARVLRRVGKGKFPCHAVLPLPGELSGLHSAQDLSGGSVEFVAQDFTHDAAIS